MSKYSSLCHSIPPLLVGQSCNELHHRYYLKGSRGDTQWQFTLHADGPNGALICRVSSGYVGPPIIGEISLGPILVNITSERRPIHIERRRSTPECTQWFRAPDDREYHWRSSTHPWRNDMQVRSCCAEMDSVETVTDCQPVLSVSGYRRGGRSYLSCYHNGHIQGWRAVHLSGMESLAFSILSIHPSRW